MPRLAVSLLVTAVAFGLAGYYAAAATGAGTERISVSAAKSGFGAQEIRVRKGRPVTFVLTTDDFMHGFSVPDFDARVDLVPGKTVELTLTPDRAGRFVFLCDNFCGDDHDYMTGLLIVVDE